MNAGGTADERHGRAGSGLGRYVAAWVAAGFVVVLVVAVLVQDHAHDHVAATVAVPPVRAVSFDAALRGSPCTVGTRPARGSPGPAPSPLRAAVYGRPLQRPAREAALRRGIIVIEYRRGIAPATLAELRLLQRTVPAATVLAPSRDPAPMILVSSARRQLSCARLTPRALDALRLFRGRYLGIPLTR